MKLKLKSLYGVKWRRIGGACRADDVSGEMMSPRQPYVHNYLCMHISRVICAY